MSGGERPPCILLVDDDEDVSAGLALALDRPGRTTIVCSDVESAELALASYPVTHVVSDVQFTGEFGFEGLHSIARIRLLSPRCRIVLMTGNATPALREAALRLGAAELLAKPFPTPELERALALSDTPCGQAHETVRFPPIEEILLGHELWTAFQPIVRVNKQNVTLFGFEALTRARRPWLRGGPAVLFDYARARGRLAQLNRAALKWALAAASELPPEAALFLNVDPVTFDDTLPSLLDVASRDAGVSLHRVVLEITERCAFSDENGVERVCAQLHERGVRFALDDHGSAYSHLSVISRIQPSFIKISNSFGTGFEHDSTKERIIRHIVFLSYDFGCETILEGIESESTARELASVGIQLAQGFHFGIPSPAARWSQPSRV